MDTGRGALHTGVCWGGIGEGQQGAGSWGEIAWGEMPDIGEGEKKSKAHCQVCTYATVLHALLMYPKTYNPIKNLKKSVSNRLKQNTDATPLVKCTHPRAVLQICFFCVLQAFLPLFLITRDFAENVSFQVLHRTHLHDNY